MDRPYYKVLYILLLLLSSIDRVIAADRGEKSKPELLGEELYAKNCAQCHSAVNSRAPQKSVLLYMSPDKIYKTLSEGPMRPMADHLSDAEQRRIAEYLSWGNRRVGEQAASRPPVRCDSDPLWFDYSKHPRASGWGITNTQNTRFIPNDVARLRASDVSKLKVKWAFAFPDTNTPRSQPAFAGGALYVGSQNGNLYALDAKSGCLRWEFAAKLEIRTAITISDWVGDRQVRNNKGPLLYFGDGSAHTYAVNAVTGKLVWKRKIDDHPTARLTGAPTLQQSEDGNRLYVPVSSVEAPMSGQTCCTFRGSVSALEADTGKLIWKSYTIPTEPVEQYKTVKGESVKGPAGAGVWTSPTLDIKRGLLYVGTGENSTLPVTNGGAVVAMDLRDGHIAWVVQPYPGEAYNPACHAADVSGYGRFCTPAFKGRFGIDVSSSPMLIRDKDGREILVAAQKPGDIYGLDPDNKGRLLWRRRVSSGDSNLGVMFGMAAEGSTIFASVMDLKKNPQKERYWGIEELGLYALDGFTGKSLWKAPVSEHCASDVPCRGYSAALTAIPGVLFAGAKDGFFRAFDSRTGKRLWEFDTTQEFIALNGDAAHGGDMDGPGAVIVDGMVYVNSGYITGNSGIKPGNVFLAFSVDGN